MLQLKTLRHLSGPYASMSCMPFHFGRGQVKFVDLAARHRESPKGVSAPGLVALGAEQRPVAR
eukprot:scaffold45140_cov41-Prasinocladus_malaysianus.AAC.1